MDEILRLLDESESCKERSTFLEQQCKLLQEQKEQAEKTAYEFKIIKDSLEAQ